MRYPAHASVRDGDTEFGSSSDSSSDEDPEVVLRRLKKRYEGERKGRDLDAF